MRLGRGPIASAAIAALVVGCGMGGASTAPSGAAIASPPGGSPSAPASASPVASTSPAVSAQPSASASADDSLTPLTPIAGYEIVIDWKETWGTGVADGGYFAGRADRPSPDVTGSARFLTGTGIVDGSRAGWASCSPGIDAPEGKDAKAEFTATIVDDTVTIAAWAAYDTPLAGLATTPLTLPVTGGDHLEEGTATNGCGTSRWEAYLEVRPL